MPRGFPTIDDLNECDTPEEKEELRDKADIIVERLEAKADSAEAFVDGPVCSFLSFLKPNAIRNAEKARAAADEAAEAAAARFVASVGGPAVPPSPPVSPSSSPPAPPPSSSVAAVATPTRALPRLPGRST